MTSEFWFNNINSSVYVYVLFMHKPSFHVAEQRLWLLVLLLPLIKLITQPLMWLLHSALLTGLLCSQTKANKWRANKEEVSAPQFNARCILSVIWSRLIYSQQGCLKVLLRDLRDHTLHALLCLSKKKKPSQCCSVWQINTGARTIRSFVKSWRTVSVKLSNSF